VYLKTKGQLESIDSRQMESLRVFHEVARALTSNLDLDHLLSTIMRQMEEFFGPEHWSLLILDHDSQELYYALTAGVDPALLSGLRLPLGKGIAGHVAATGQALVVPDVTADHSWASYAIEHPELNLRSIACLPVCHGDRVLGVLQLHNSHIDLLPESSLSFLRVLCDYTAIALENSRHVKLIHQLSITDDCTGLFNGRHLYTALEQEIASATQARVVSIQPRFSLLFLDLDHFKSINDTYGHLTGSRLLAEIGSLLKRTLGPDHAAFRYGGDEFVALLRGLDKAAATALTNHLRVQLNSTRFLSAEGLSLSINASFGLATFPQDGNTLPEIIRSADTMMYVAKERGRNCIAIADSGAHTSMGPPRVSRHNYSG
jgi:diguanylate cyclase (GGDEF)-like protein